MAGSGSHATLNYSTSDHVAHASFARPERQNSLSEEALDDLGDVIRNVQGDTQIRTLVISGEGDAFSVGLDGELLERAYGDLEYFEHLLTRLAATCLSLEALEVPVIAQVGGSALAAGFELALACDMIVIADDAEIGDGQLAAGVVPGGGASIRLPRMIGVQHARELIYSGRRISGTEAAKLGLALRSVPASQLEEAVSELAASFVDKSRSALGTAKRQLNRGLGVDTATGVEHERRELIRYVRESGAGALAGLRSRPQDGPATWA